MAKLTIDEFIEEIKNNYCPFEDNEAIGSPNTGKEYTISSSDGDRVSVIISEPFEEDRHYCLDSLEEALEFIREEEAEHDKIQN